MLYFKIRICCKIIILIVIFRRGIHKSIKLEKLVIKIYLKVLWNDEKLSGLFLLQVSISGFFLLWILASFLHVSKMSTGISFPLYIGGGVFVTGAGVQDSVAEGFGFFFGVIAFSSIFFCGRKANIPPWSEMQGHKWLGIKSCFNSRNFREISLKFYSMFDCCWLIKRIQ